MLRGLFHYLMMTHYHHERYAFHRFLGLLYLWTLLSINQLLPNTLLVILGQNEIQLSTFRATSNSIYVQYRAYYSTIFSCWEVTCQLRNQTCHFLGNFCLILQICSNSYYLHCHFRFFDRKMEHNWDSRFYLYWLCLIEMSLHLN